MTNTLLQTNPFRRKLRHIYGFIHIEDRIQILMEQYNDKFISNNSVWYP